MFAKNIRDTMNIQLQVSNLTNCFVIYIINSIQRFLRTDEQLDLQLRPSAL